MKYIKIPKVQHKRVYYGRKLWLTQALKQSINVKHNLYITKCKDRKNIQVAL